MARADRECRQPAPDPIREPASHRNGARCSHSVTANARRAAGAFLLATLALFAFAPIAHGQATNTLTLSVSHPSISESAGSGTTVTVTVATSHQVTTFNAASTVTVNVAGGGDNPATAGTDFTAVSSFTITLPANTHSATGTFTFTPTADEIVEGDETVLVSATATNPSPQVTFAVNSATITITDDDQSFASTADASAVAGNPVDFTISLTKAADVDLEVTLSTFETGSASAGTDFEAQTGATSTITAGQTSTTISVPTVADDNTVVEASKTFGAIINITPHASHGGRVGLDATASVGSGIIQDDDTRSDAPTGLTATTQQSTGDDINLRWSPPSDTGLLNGAAAAITGYQYRSAATSGGLSSATWTATGGTGTTYTVGSPTANDVFFQVRAVTGVTDADGNPAPSAASNEAMVASASEPGRVTDLSVSLSGSTATLTWTVPSDGGLAFTELDVSVDTGSGFFLPNAEQVDNPGGNPGTQTSRTLSGSYTSTTKFRIRYENAIGLGDYSNVVMAGLDAPGNVRASALNNNNNGTDRLAWDASTGATGYDVQRRQAGQTDWEDSVAVAATVTSHDFAKASGTSGSAYDYRVRANNSSGNGVWSGHVTVAGRPGGISDLSATASTSVVAVDLSWTAPSSGGRDLTGYRVEWRVDATGDWNANTASGHTTAPGSNSSFTVNAGHGLQANTVYDFRIRADNPDRVSFYSNTAQADQATVELPAPTNLTVTGQSPTSIVVSWDAPADEAAVSHYMIRWKLSSASSFGDDDRISRPKTSSTTRAIDSLTPGTYYDIEAYSCADAACNDRSPTAATLTTHTAPPAGATAPAAPALTYDKPQSRRYDPLNWTEPSDGGSPITDYEYRSRELGTTPWGDWTSTMSTSTALGVDKGATTPDQQKAYEYQVRAVNVVGDGAASNTVLIGTYPTDLGTLTATAAASGVAVTLSWPAPTNTGGKDITGYIVQWRLDSNNNWGTDGPSGQKTLGNVNTVTVTDLDGLAGSTTYNFRYRADNTDRVSFYKPGDGSVEATTAAAGPPPAPQNLTATPGEQVTGLDQSKTRLTWDAPVSDGGAAITQYFVRWRETGGSWGNNSATLDPPPNPLQYDVTGLQAHVQYEYQVLAINSATTITNGNFGAATLVGRPGVPTNLAATQVSGQVAVDLTWTAPTNTGGSGVPITQYVVQWRPDSNNDWATDGFTGEKIVTSGTSVRITGADGLDLGTTYNFRIRAHNAVRASFHTPGAGEVEAATVSIGASIFATNPSPLTERGLNGARLTVDLVGTQYAASLDPGDFGLLPPGTGGLSVASVNAQSTTRAVLTLAFTGNFAADLDLRVVVDGSAHTGSSTSLTTPAVSVTQAPTPGQVTGVTLTPGPASFGVSWTPVSNADGYKVQWAADGQSFGSSRQVVVDGGGSRTTTLSLEGETRYRVRVIATSDYAPDGTPSSSGSHTTLPGRSVSVDDAEASEGDAMTFTVSIGQAVSEPVTVNWATSDGTGARAATAGSDYTAANGSVTIPANTNSATFSVATIEDVVYEYAETFRVTLSAPSGGLPNTPEGQVQLAADPTATGTIRDDDPQPVLTAGTGGVTEGDSGTSRMLFNLRLEPESGLNLPVNGRGVTVDWRTEDGTARAPGDYETRSGTVTFAPGERLKTVGVPIAGDVLVEDDETVVLALSNLRGATFRSFLNPVGGTGRASGTITDDDDPPTSIALNASPLTVSEDAGATTVTVTASFPSGTALSSDTSVAVDIGLPANDALDATRGTDYTAPGNLTVTIPAGQTTGTAQFVLTPIDDAVVERAQEQIVLSGTVPEEYGTRSLFVRLFLIDDEAAATLVLTPAEIVEGGVATVTARLSRAVQGQTTLTVSAAPESGTDAADFTLSGTTLTIPAGQTVSTGTVTVTANEDQDENHERVRISATVQRPSIDIEGVPRPVGSAVAAPAAVTLPIRDNDGSDVPETTTPPPPPAPPPPTSQANRAPSFPSAALTREVAEDAAIGTAVGDPVTATDADGDDLTYTLSGADAAAFAIDEQTGQLTLTAALDHERADTHALQVTATDADGASASVDVTVAVLDVAEPPAAPGAPEVTASAGGLHASWTEPANTGPPITGYDVQYRAEGETAWSDADPVTATEAELGGLVPNTLYEVRVRATNDEGTGPWSSPGAGRTAAVNRAPAFASDALTLEVAENAAPGTAVGDPVTAEDADGDALTYTLSGDGAAAFAIDALSGQLTLSAALDYEQAQSQVLQVTATDGQGATDSVAVTVAVLDVAEPPGAPDSPSVTASAGGLRPSWTEPANTGPPITGYELQYRAAGATAWTDADPTADTEAQLTGLETNTAYEVRVRALNDEGTGAWSSAVSGRTAAAELTVRYGAASYEVAEGATVTVTATLSPSADRDVTIPVQGNVPAAILLSFLRGESEVELEFTAPQDEDVEDETFTLGFGALPPGVTAGTPSEATVRVTDDDRAVQERIERLNEALLGRQALLVMDDVNYAVSSRVQSLHASVPPRTASSGGASSSTSSGRAPSGTSYGASDSTTSGTSDSATPGVTSSGSSGAAPALSYRLGGHGDLAGLWTSSAQALGTDSFDWARLLDGASFSMPLSALGLNGTNGANGAGTNGTGTNGTGSDCSGALCGLTLWGSGSFHNLSGSNGLNWDGELLGGLLGLDARISPNLLAGLTASHSQGSFDYADSADGATGEYDTDLTSVHPYLGWSSGNGLRLWGSAGFGQGEIGIEETGRAMQSSDTGLQAFSVGGSGAIRTTGDGTGSRVEWNLKGEATLAEVELDGGGLIQAGTVDGSRLRVAIERRGERALEGGGSFASMIELGARRDEGFEQEAGSASDIEPAAGAELGVGLQWRSGRVAFGARARGLLGGETEEWGANMILSVTAGADGQGLSLTLNPSWGVADSGIQRLWDQGVSHLTSTAASAPPVPGSFHAVRTNLEIGYGVRNRAGLFTPFGELAAQGPNRAYKAGLRMKLDSGWNLSLQGEHRMGLTATDTALMLTFQWGAGSTSTMPLPHAYRTP